MIEEWGVKVYSTQTTSSVTFPVVYKYTPNCEGHNMANNADSPQYRMNPYDINSNGFSFYAIKGDFSWIAIGY